MLTKAVSGVLVVALICLHGCAGPAHIPDAHRQPDRSGEYPVGIITSQSTPETGVDFSVRGKGQGAGAGAVEGMLSCMDAASGGSDFAALALLLCLPIGTAVGAAAGAVTTASSASAAATETALAQQALAHASQARLAENVQARLAGDSATPVAGIIDTAATSTGTAAGYSTLLEVGLLEIIFKSSGKKTAPLCLHMKASATKRDAASGQQLDTLESVYHGDCLTHDDWVSDSGSRVIREVATGYTMLSENIADELYLGYVPDTDNSVQNAGRQRQVPRYVLAPEYPPLEEPKFAFKPFKHHQADYGGYGGLQFTTIDSLTPVFTWEAFPRAFDSFTLPGSVPEDISYELRLYQGAVTELDAVAPLRVLLTVRSIRENRYALPHTLKPCNWYFWTVRARFTLSGSPHVTEWAGAYTSLGGDLSPSADRRSSGNLLRPWPSSYLYYPFRTPADAAYGGECHD